MALSVTPALSGAGTGGLLGLVDPSLASGSVRDLSQRNEAESGRAGHPMPFSGPHIQAILAHILPTDDRRCICVYNVF